MNDLSGLNWDSTRSASQQPRPNNAPNYAALRPTPPQTSRQATPLSEQHSGRSTPPSGPARASGQDSFSNLLPTKKPPQLSLQERQKQLIEERARQQAEQQRRHNEQFKLDDTKFWEGLGHKSGSTSPAPNGRLVASTNEAKAAQDEDEEDILAAFNSSAPVDKSSHFPPTQSSDGLKPDAVRDQKGLVPPQAEQNRGDRHLEFEDDDDPFGLVQINPAPTTSRVPAPAPVADLSANIIEDDDVLGMLGKPVEEVSRARQPKQAPAPVINAPSTSSTEPRDQAIAELVDMGFSVDQSREALDQTESGNDVQAAVGWILNQAHKRSKNKSGAGQSQERFERDGSSRKAEGLGAEVPEDRLGRDNQRNRPNQDGARSSPSNIDAELAQRAAQLGNSFFQTANSLWSKGQKRMQKAMAEFQQEANPNQPRWMTQSHLATDNEQQGPSPERQSNVSRAPVITDEAILLDAQRPQSRPSSTTSSRKQMPRQDTDIQQLPPRRVRNEDEHITSLPSRPTSRPIERVNKQSIEEQSAKAYVSPARRKKAQPQEAPPPPQSPPEPELDIFSMEAPTPAPVSKPAPELRSSGSAPSRTRTTLPLRSAAPSRLVPTVSPSSLSQSATHRVEGSAAFKRGDYTSSHSSYTSAIAPLPTNHPINIVLYCNRSLTSLKTGDSKAAMADADTALGIIGPSRGEGEVVSIDPGEPEKPMKEFYGKAIMRKAEALEQMEKWAEAAKVWQDAVEFGVGGAVSIQSRNRCEKAAGITPASTTSSTGRQPTTAATKPPPAKPIPKPRSAANDLAAPGAKQTKAVEKLRAANAAAAAAADEAFEVNDMVEARLQAWKNGKEGNLRGLLASLDDVLWESAGWTKVGMGDLVLPNKCKIIYMKAIGKVHPDKIPTNATTEQRMVSASVFSTLNEAWDRFKRDNGL